MTATPSDSIPSPALASAVVPELGDRAAGANRGPWLLWLALYLLWALAIYAPSLNGPFIFDDYHVLQPRTLGEFLEYFPYSLRRILPHLSLYGNYAVGGQEPLGYHLVSLLLHVLCALAVAVLLVQVQVLWPGRGPAAERPATGARRRYWPLAGLGGLLFLVHPLATQSVSYMAQRYTVVAGAGVLWCLALWLLARRRQAEGQPTAWLWSGACLLAVASFLSKEFTFCLPGLLIVADLLLAQPGITWRRRLMPYLPVMVLWGLTAILYLPGFNPPAQFTPLDHSGMEGVLPDWGMGTDFNRLRYFATELDLVHRIYLRLLILPLGQSLDHYWVIRHSLLETAPLVGLVMLVTALGLAAWSWRRWPLVSLAILFFYLTLAPTSTIIPNNEPVAEHRTYLALLALPLLLLQWANRRSWRMILAATLPWLLAASVLTVQRNRLWASEEAIWRAATEASPGRSRPWLQLGDVYYKSTAPDRLLQAAVNYAEFLHRNQTFPPAFLRLGVTLGELGRFADARDTLTQGLRLAPGDYDLNLAMIRLEQQAGKPAAALAHARLWLSRQPDSLEALQVQGDCARQQGDYELAITSYRRVTQRRPQAVEAWLGLAQTQAEAGQMPAALATLQELRQKVPQAAPRALYERGLLYAHSGDDAAAVREYQAGLALAPRLPHLHLALAQVLAHQGELLEAARHAQTAQSLGLAVPAELLQQLQAPPQSPAPTPTP
jgi:protein O-mannosyl-transferase